MNLKDLQAPETLETFANELKIFQEKGSRIFKTINKCKDGKTFPVEVNLQRFVIEWSEFYQAIIRDLG
jgi:hypothetical protein